MSYVFDSRLGEQLYRLLPEVYRSRDRHKDVTRTTTGTEALAKYLDAHGHLLDLIQQTLQQQLEDTTPDLSQDWLLGYFAQLLAANIVSPDSAGKHAEVTNAVGWRQRKGTLKCAEEIGEAVGQMEVEIQEGWQRVAMTPRLGMPLIPETAWDNTLELDITVPSQVTRHPGLPAMMLDLRRPSRAVEATSNNPASRTSKFAGVKQVWRQLNRHGLPCFPGSFEDQSSRTVDMRTANWQNGHFHPKRLLAFAPPGSGLFGFKPIRITWEQRKDSLYEHLIEEKQEGDVWLLRNTSDRIIEITDAVVLSPAKVYRLEHLNFTASLSVASGGSLELYGVEAVETQVDTPSTEKPVLIAEHCLFGELSVGSGLCELDSCSVLDIAYLTSVHAVDCIFIDIAGTDITGVLQNSRIPADSPLSQENMILKNCSSDEPLFFAGQANLAARAVLAPGTTVSVFAGATDDGEMGYFHQGRESRAVRISGDFIGADALSLPTDDAYQLSDLIFEGSVEILGESVQLLRTAFNILTINATLADAKDCLFDFLTVTAGLARLEYCTIMKSANCLYLQASDCLFAGLIGGISADAPESGCIRYSRIPANFAASSLNIGSGFTNTNTRATPILFTIDVCLADSYEQRLAEFGEAGYGVLHSATATAIRFGAEDGGEMGVGHHKYYSLKADAMLDKMLEFLPVGIEPVLIQDKRLWQVPPQTMILSNGETS
ncbi:MAG: hypothetical protein GY820_45650 [Gammaproteobacteria bacterium]|nr:hypothetical protein [Gammaproteobacteria bacterium]